MGFFSTVQQMLTFLGKRLIQSHYGMIALVILLLSVGHPVSNANGHQHGIITQSVVNQTTKRVHPSPTSLTNWISTNSNDDYFQAIAPLPLGYFIWSNRPVTIYVGPSHFTDPSRQQAWEEGVQAAIVDWQQYFPLEHSAHPDANIVIEQIRPQRTSNGRIRSAQAIPSLQCLGDRLTHSFTIQISPSQTSRYIKAATRHELGHALGLWGHSDNPKDVMYQAQVSHPPNISERDINTLKRIYRQPTLLGWPNPQYCSASQGESPKALR